MSSSGRSPLPTVNERDAEQVRRGSAADEGGPGSGGSGEGRQGGKGEFCEGKRGI